MAKADARTRLAWAMGAVIVIVMLSMWVTSWWILVRRSCQVRGARLCVRSARGRYRAADGSGKRFVGVSPLCYRLCRQCAGSAEELQDVGAVPVQLLATDPTDPEEGLGGLRLELGDQLQGRIGEDDV